MSGKSTGRVWDMRLRHDLKFVLLAYADHADHEGRNMHPGIQLIVWKTEYSESEVHRCVRELREMGLLVPQGKGPRGTINYDLGEQGGATLAPCQDDRGVNLREGGGVNSAPQFPDLRDTVTPELNGQTEDTDIKRDGILPDIVATARLMEVLDAVLGNDRQLWAVWHQHGGRHSFIKHGKLMIATADPEWCQEHLGRLMQNQLNSYDPPLSVLFFSIAEEAPDD